MSGQHFNHAESAGSQRGAPGLYAGIITSSGHAGYFWPACLRKLSSYDHVMNACAFLHVYSDLNDF